MADSPIYLLNPAPTLVGTERIPLDVAPFGVAGSTSYATPNQIATFLNSLFLNGNLTLGYLPVATGAKTLGDSRVFQDGNIVSISSVDGLSFFQVKNNDNKFRTVDINGAGSEVYQTLAQHQFYWNNGLGAIGYVVLDVNSTNILHTAKIILSAPTINVPSLTANKIIGTDVNSNLVATNLQTSDLTNLVPVTIVFTANWSTQTLPDVSTLFYFVNASNSTAKTINLPATPTANNYIVIKDKKGDAATNNITIQGNGKLIDGVSSILINGNNQAYTLKYDGSAWNLI